ncbi:MAG: hypothetical protein M3N53_00395 [Actinomycetota bacterium]|nr:hypothetical protein [Actinomycetota bacterium]
MMELESTWNRHHDGRRGFSLEWPADWQVQRGMSGLLLSIAPPSDGDGFVPNLNLVRHVNDMRSDLDDLAKRAAREVLRVLTDVTLVDADATVVAGSPARRLLFSYRQGIYGLTSEQWLFLTPEHVWTITAGSESDDYDAFADVFSGIVRSLRLHEHVE